MAHIFIAQLVLILLSARLLGELAERCKLPPVIGELFAGVLLGPSLLGWIDSTESIQLLAKIGIILFLFEVGIEADFQKLSESGLKAGAAAIAGVIGPFVLGYWVSAHIFALDVIPSFFIASTMTATSIGITVRVLNELGRQKGAETQIVLGAAILDDIIGIVILSVLYEFTLGGHVSFMQIIDIIPLIIFFVIVAPITAKIISSLINRYEERSNIPGLLPTMIVAFILSFAWFAEFFKAPELLGGFAAGLALSPTFRLPLPTWLVPKEQFSSRVLTAMRPIIYLFAPIFFVDIGLSLNARAIDWSSPFIWAFSSLLLLTAVIGKLAAGFMLWGESRFVRWTVGIAMIPRGEVGLVFAEVGRVQGVFNQELYAGIIIVIACTTIITPCVMRRIYARN